MWCFTPWNGSENTQYNSFFLNSLQFSISSVLLPCYSQSFKGLTSTFWIIQQPSTCCCCCSFSFGLFAVLLRARNTLKGRLEPSPGVSLVWRWICNCHLPSGSYDRDWLSILYVFSCLVLIVTPWGFTVLWFSSSINSFGLLFCFRWDFM